MSRQVSLLEHVERRHRHTPAARTPEQVSADYQRLEEMVLAQAPRHEICARLEWSDVTLRNALKILRRRMGDRYVQPPRRKRWDDGLVKGPNRRVEKRRAPVEPVAVDPEASRDADRLRKIDSMLAKAKRCPACGLRMFTGACEACPAVAERSTGLGQTMAAFVSA